MINGTTSAGFNFSISEDITDDYEIFETLCEVDKGEYTKVPDLINALLGDEQSKALKKFLKERDGKVSTKQMLKAIEEIFNSCNEGKNL